MSPYNNISKRLQQTVRDKDQKSLLLALGKFLELKTFEDFSYFVYDEDSIFRNKTQIFTPTRFYVESKSGLMEEAFRSIIGSIPRKHINILEQELAEVPSDYQKQKETLVEAQKNIASIISCLQKIIETGSLRLGRNYCQCKDIFVKYPSEKIQRIRSEERA